ncbi:tyrosine-type recombinase/integrase [bacterium]|nr:tyrosine-type recombinase/integrase [bacterium]
MGSVKRVSGEVFCQPDGRRFISIRNGFEAAVKRAGIPHIRFHDLRHTFATRYMGKGDVVTLKDILGHKTIDMTLRYAHATLEKKRWCVDMLNVTLNGHYMDTKAEVGVDSLFVSH